MNTPTIYPAAAAAAADTYPSLILYSGSIRLLLLLSRSPSFVCCTARSFLPPADADFLLLGAFDVHRLELPGQM